MIDRRDLLILLGAAAFAPRLVRAQSKKPVLIGWLHASSRELDGHFLAAFKQGLTALGWQEGSQFVIEERWANGYHERQQPLARTLAAMKPAVIVTAPLQATATVAKEAPGIPIVMAAGADPVQAGLAASLARPGGMVTGVTNVVTNVTEKQLEFLLAAAPKLRQIGFLADSNNRARADILKAAQRSVAQYPSVQAHFAEMARPEEIEPAISRLAREGIQGLIILASPMFTNERQRIARLALTRRWPAIGLHRAFAEEGILLSYGTELTELYRRAAYYVDRILKGAKPGDLPIEQPTKIELVINMKTARALKLEIPRDLAVRADRVIE